MTAPRTLDAVASDLYRARPSDFVDRRDQHVKRLRDGDRALAEEVSRLRKPTLAAWAVDQVSLRDPDLVGELVTAGDRARSAHADADIDARTAIEALYDLVERAVGRAAEHLGELGVDGGGHLDDIRRSLTAAAVDPDVRDAVVQGRLVRPLDAPGFDALSGLDLGAVTPRQRSGPIELDRRREAHKERERTRLRRSLDIARRELDRAERRQAQLRRELDDAAAETASLQDRETRLQRELDEL